MKRRFKGRRKKNNHKVLLFIIITIISFYITMNILFNNILKKESDNTKLVNLLLNNNLNINNESIEDVFDVNLKRPLNLLNYNFSNIIKSDEEIDNERLEAVLQEQNKEDENKTEIDISKPLVYIYSTHQTEEYKMTYKENYSINPTVMIASYILQEKLNNLNIPTIVEKESMAKIRNENNWDYAKAYRASRLLMEKAKENNPSLIYFIDLHRDSAPYTSTVTTINDKSYAKVLFVVGKDANKYDENLKFVVKINEKLKSVNPSLSRGIFLRTGTGSNGIYNQNFNSRTILIELGAQDNSIEEVSNTIEILSEVLKDVISGDNYE